MNLHSVGENISSLSLMIQTFFLIYNTISLAADVELAAYGVSKDATEEQLKEFISNKGICVTDVKKLTTYEQARTNTFKALKLQTMIKLSDLKSGPWELVSDYSDQNEQHSHGLNNQQLQVVIFRQLRYNQYEDRNTMESEVQHSVLPLLLLLHWHQSVQATDFHYLETWEISQFPTARINSSLRSFNKTDMTKLCFYSYNSRGFSAEKQDFCSYLFKQTGDFLPILCNQENFLYKSSSYKVQQALPDAFVFFKPAHKDSPLTGGRPQNGMFIAIPKCLKNVSTNISPLNWRLQSIKIQLESAALL